MSGEFPTVSSPVEVGDAEKTEEGGTASDDSDTDAQPAESSATAAADISQDANEDENANRKDDDEENEEEDGGREAQDSSPAVVAETAVPVSSELSVSTMGKADAWKEPHPNAPQPLRSAQRVSNSAPVRRSTPAIRPSTPTPHLGGSSPKVAPVSAHLTQLPKRRELPPLPKGKQLSKEEQAGLVERLYQATLNREKVKRERLDSQLRDSKGIKLTGEMEVEMVERIFYHQMMHEKLRAQELNRKYLTPKMRQTLSAGQVQLANQRLFYESCSAKQKRMDDLYAKYVSSTDPHFKKLSSNALVATTNRLYGKE